MLVGQQVGPFAIKKEIGSGAMGTVYRALYSKNEAEVAIKVISQGLLDNPTTLARFDREAAILKTLDHPNIVRLFGTGRYRKTPFYIMEFIEGESLEAMLQRRGRFTWEEVVTLGKQICGALQHAHGKGIVHRDLKPANIMMMPDGTAKLMDFGIAKGLEVTQLTATNCAVGTAAYMSPEQCRGEKNLTFKSDLYSLGVMFYELLTGQRPFLAETTLDMFLAHTEGKFERPSRLVLDIPIWLDTLVCQLMEKDPQKRPFDAAMVAQSLTRVEEKVAAQRSVGMDAVGTQVIDRPRMHAKVDETDRQAARILKAGSSKRRVKSYGRPIYERIWFQALAISAVLLAVAAITMQAMKPPAPDQLLRMAGKLMESKDTDDWAKARAGPIKDFLAYYPNRNDEDARKMHFWADQYDLNQRERQLHNRMKMRLTPEGDAETMAQAAVRREEAGDLDAALERWQQAEKLKDSPDEDQRTWALLAQKRINEIQGVAENERQITDSAEVDRRAGVGTEPADEGERLALLATRAEMFGDGALAMSHWKALKETYQSDLEKRPWFLLGAKKVKEGNPDAERGSEEKAQRLKRVREKTSEAEKIKTSAPAEARIICGDVVVLYGKSTDKELRDLAARCRKILKELAPADLPAKP